MKKRRKRLIILGIVLIIITAGSITFLRSAIGIALFKSKAHFKTSSIDRRVLYEPGAEEYAEKIARFLPEAVLRVEAGHYMPIRRSFNVYVCATQESFNEYVAKSGWGRGAATINNVYISPTAFSFRGLDTHKESLMHELSHFHLGTKYGLLKITSRMNIPAWFSEGIANTIAGSGGEGISEGEAVGSILNGRHFKLKTTGSLFGSFVDNFGNVSGWMFHRQNRMFVKFIRDSYPAKFKPFMLGIQLGFPFADCFKINFGTDINGMWERFRARLASK
jgi:hypothetical protein